MCACAATDQSVPLLFRNNEAVPSSLLYWLNGFRQDKVTHVRRLLAFCSLDKLIVLLNQYESQVVDNNVHTPSTDEQGGQGEEQDPQP